MSVRSQERRAQLRITLVEAAELRIARDGLAELRARDLSKDAGCSVGAIYNVFDDLQALIMEVNGRTFRALGQTVSASIQPDQPPTERLVSMSHAYLHYAAAHTNLWRALFDLRMTDDGSAPDWYREALGGLFAMISDPVSQLFPEMGKVELDLMTRALFSSVHGIVLLGLENRISGVPPERIETMIAQVLTRIGN